MASSTVDPRSRSSDVEGHGYVAVILLPVDVVGAIPDLHLGELRQRDSFSRGGEQANVRDRLLVLRYGS